MKSILKLIFTALLIISECTNCTTASADTFKVDLDLTGVADTVKVLLRPVSHNRKVEALAKGQFNNGRVSLTGAIDVPTPVYVFLSNATSGFPIFIENGTVTVKGNITGQPSKRDASFIDYNFENLEISGSENYPTFLEIIELKEKLNKEFYAMRKQYSTLLDDIREAHQAGDKERQETLRNSEAYRAYEQAEHDHAEKVTNEYQKLIAKHKGTFWGPVAMLYLYVYFTPDMRPMYEQFSEEAKATKFGQEIKKELYPVGRPGDKLENFTAPTADGVSVSLMDVARESKITLIDFWASWCRPCRAEIPNLKKIYELYHDKGFDIVSVSIDDEDANWRKALAKEKMPWTNCRDTEKDIRDTYGVQSIPMLVAVDSEGKMVFENIRGEELIAKIGELLTTEN